MDTLLSELRHALRGMQRSRGFALTAVALHALGIGAITAVFSLIYGVFIRPLPYPAANRIVELWEEHPGGAPSFHEHLLSNITYLAWRQAPQTLEFLTSYGGGQMTVGLPTGPDHLLGGVVGSTLLPMLGAVPARGRFFLPSESRPPTNNVIVLSDRLWRDRFNSDPDVVGRVLSLDRQAMTVVGVAAGDFYFPDRDTLFWVPFDRASTSTGLRAGVPPRVTAFHALARLRPGVTPDQAAAEGTVLARSQIRGPGADDLFGVGGPVVVHATPLIEELTGNVRPALAVLGLTALFVLVMTSTNVASLYLARGITRQRELAIRTAMGATRAQLVRQLLTEALVVSITGGVAGVAVAWIVLEVGRLAASQWLPRAGDIHMDGPVLAAAIMATLLMAVMAGLLPALQVSRKDVTSALHAATATVPRRTVTTRQAMLAVQAAFAMVLVVGASLLTRSFIRLIEVDPGFTAVGVTTARVFLPSSVMNGDTQSAHVASSVLEQLRALPGVLAAGASTMMPLDGGTTFTAPLPIASRKGQTAGATVQAVSYIVTPGYAEALRLRLLAGRFFTEGDVATVPQRVMVNQEFARLYLPPDPIGRTWKAPHGDLEIVAVVGNVLKDGQDRQPRPEIYSITAPGTPIFSRFAIVVRADGDPTHLGSTIERTVRAAAPDAAVEVATLTDRVSRALAGPRYSMVVVGLFATVAVWLAGVGLYGVLSFFVSQRQREFGIRSALGASHGQLSWMVVREGLVVAVTGMVAGALIAAATSRVMQRALFGIKAHDPASFGVAALVVLLVMAVMCISPAVRGASVSPSEAMRED